MAESSEEAFENVVKLIDELSISSSAKDLLKKELLWLKEFWLENIWEEMFMAGRNVFENGGEPEGTMEEALELADKVHSVLPPLTDGHHYNLTPLSNGRMAIVVEEDKDEPVKPPRLYRTVKERRAQVDQFGRRRL